MSRRNATLKRWAIAVCAAIVAWLAPRGPNYVDQALPTYPAAPDDATARTQTFPAPKLLQADLQRLRQSFGEEVRIAVLGLDANWMAHVGGEIPAPQ